MRLLLFFLLLSSLSASASTIAYWHLPGSVDLRFPDGDSACKHWMATSVFVAQGPTLGRCAYGPGNSYTLGNVHKATEVCEFGNTGLNCNASCDAPNQMVDGQCVVPVVPGGQSCQRDGTPNTGLGFITDSSGECVDWTRADLPSQCSYLGGKTDSATVGVYFNDDGSASGPPLINELGCEARPYGYAHCVKAPVRCGSANGLGICMESSTASCVVDVKFTGGIGSDSDSMQIVPPGQFGSGLCDPVEGCAPPPDAPIQNHSKPCVYTYDGEGRRVCDSSQFNAVPGKTSCGTVNGEFQCIGKAPTSNGIHIGTTITDTQNPDGTTTSVKDDTITHTQCVGANACTTTTTRNSTVVIKDGAGNTVGQSGSCTGPLCAPDGKGDKDGDGVKDCIGPRCAEEGEEEEFGGPENDEVGSFGETTAQFMDRVEGSPIVSAARGLSFGSGGSCSFGTFTVPILGTLSFQPVCAWAAEWLGPLRSIMLAVWALVAIRTFFEA